MKGRRSECCRRLSRPPGKRLDLRRLPPAGQESVVMMRGRGPEAGGGGGRGQARGGQRLRHGYRGHRGGGGHRGRGEAADLRGGLGLLGLGRGLSVDRHNSFILQNKQVLFILLKKCLHVLLLQFCSDFLSARFFVELSLS